MLGTAMALTPAAYVPWTRFLRFDPVDPQWFDRDWFVLSAGHAWLAHGLASGRLDLALVTRVGRAHAEGLRLIVAAWNQVYRARFEGPLLAAGATSARPWSWPPS